jgi:hypothetical protein
MRVQRREIHQGQDLKSDSKVRLRSNGRIPVGGLALLVTDNP